MQHQKHKQSEAAETVKSKFDVNVKELKRAVKQLKRSINKKPDTMPILAGIHFKVNNDNIELFATNLETATRLRVEADVKASGQPFVVKGYKLDRILKSESGTATVEELEDKNQVRFTVDGINYDLFKLAVEEYPETELLADELVGIFNKDKFVDMVYTSEDFALNTKETTRLSLTGIYLSDGKAVATNGYIMMVEDNFGAMTGDVLMGPANQLKKIRPTLKKFDGETIELYKVNEAAGNLDLMISDSSGNHQLFISDIMEQFPEYEAVIPEHNEIAVKPVDVDKIEKFSDKAARMLDSDTGGMYLDFDGDNLRLSASGPETGNLSTDIETEMTAFGSQTDIRIMFKADFVNRVFDNSGDEVTVWLQDKDTAGLFDDENSDRKFILMPIDYDQE